MANITDTKASTLLGKKIESVTEYKPDLLVAVPRYENRERYNIAQNNLPFEGWDVWHCYEFSVLTENGIPVTRVLKLKYNCNSEYIVESKSLKLYLNSFNMTKYGKSTKDCLSICKEIIEKDLSNLLNTNAEVNFVDNNSTKIEIFTNYKNIMQYVSEENLEIKHYKESPELLAIEDKNDIQEYYIKFDSLRSNCRVTHQPDFGDAFIYYKSSKHIKEESMLKYLCSFRSEYHFHEECCEMIFKRLYDLLNNEDELFVGTLYTRRGGIDICPVRWKKNTKISEIDKLLDLNKIARNGIKQ